MTQVQKRSLAILVPVFNEAESISGFARGMASVLDDLWRRDVELVPRLVFVDDGSRDGTVEVITKTVWPVDVQVIVLSRNFGKEAAMTAGLARLVDDAVVIMDIDLQDPPELIHEMVRAWSNGAKVVLGRRVDRSDDGIIKRITAHCFYRLHNSISNIHIPYNVGDFRLMDRKVIDVVNQLPENRRFMKGLFAWVGFEPVYLNYKRRSRDAGVSKFTTWRLWRLAIEGITSFSEVPLVVWSYLGGLIALSSFVYASVIVVRTLLFGLDVPGYASQITIILFLGGRRMIGKETLEEYIGRVYSEVKRRPPFVISDEIHISAQGSDDEV